MLQYRRTQRQSASDAGARPCTVGSRLLAASHVLAQPVPYMLAFLDSIPLSLLIILALALGLAPFFPEPHLWEKLKMLADGNLRRPVDIFDLLMHGAPVVVLALKLLRMGLTRS